MIQDHFLTGACLCSHHSSQRFFFLCLISRHSKGQATPPRSQADTPETGTSAPLPPGLCCPTATAHTALWPLQNPASSAYPRNPEGCRLPQFSPLCHLQLTLGSNSVYLGGEANALSLQEERLHPTETLCKDEVRGFDLIKPKSWLRSWLRLSHFLWTCTQSTPRQDDSHTQIPFSSASSSQSTIWVTVCAAEGTVKKGLGWAGLGDAESGRVAARQANKAQKLRLNRASESWLISRQYGSRCRMKSTLWS